VPELLDDFSQADASETRRVGGMGLGLSFVRRLADEVGIPFVVRTTPGQGSEFALDLPVAAAPSPRAPRRRAAAGRAAR
jgi:signal transduction histidine kinase